MKINSNINLVASQEALKANKEAEVENSFKQALEVAEANGDDDKVKEACKEMETYFIQQLYKIMRESTKMGEGIIPKGQHEEIFEDMLIEEQSKQATNAGGIGLADMLYKQLSMEKLSKPSPLEK